VWSEVGQGTCFMLVVPRNPLATWRESPLVMPPESESLAGILESGVVGKGDSR